jgi:hypothetical protein
VWNTIMPRLAFLPGMASPTHSGELLANFALGIDHHELRGGYVELHRVKQPSTASFDPQREAALWAACNDLVAAVVQGGQSATGVTRMN